MSKFETYFNLIKSFVKENITIFENAKIYKKSTCAMAYIPPYKNPNKDFIGFTKEFNTLYEEIIHKLFIEDDIYFNLNGHYKEYENLKLSDLIKDDNRNGFLEDIKLKIIIDLFTIYIKKEEDKFNSNLFFSNNSIIYIVGQFNCPDCGAYITTNLNFDKNQITSFNAIEDCPFIAGTPDFININLKVPSKKLVFLNDPRIFIKLEREDRYKNSINYLLGCIKETEMYAEKNIGYFFIGNCYPSILQKKSEIVFTNGYSGEDDEIDDNVEYNNTEYQFRGNVCTGLWWYTVLDYDLFSKLCKEQSVLEADIEHTVVEIENDNCSIKHSLEAHKEGDSDKDLSFISF